VRMSSHLLLLGLALLSTIAAGNDLCEEPLIPNGEIVVVNGKKTDNFFLGDVVCNRGFERIGNPRIRCRKGLWSGALPVCTVLGSCQPIEVPRNGRVIPVRGSRESAYRFGCNIGFHLLGESSSHCVGHTWSHTSLPVCAKSGCSEAGLAEFNKDGKALSLLEGALYKFSCPAGSPLIGSPAIYCDGKQWNSSIPYCQLPPSEPSTIDILVGGQNVNEVRVSDSAILTCTAISGNPTPDVQVTIDGKTYPPQNFIDSIMLKIAEDTKTQLDVSCTASNVAGSSTTTITIPVLVAPESMTIEGPEGLRQNAVNQFKCHVARGNPPPKITWTVEDEEGERKEEGEVLNLVTKDFTSDVVIRCHAENSEGDLSAFRRVPVHHLPSFVTISTTVDATSKKVLEGSLISFHCTAAPALPKPFLVWTIENEDGVQIIDDVQITQDERGVLASSELTLPAVKAGIVTARCSAFVDQLGQVDAEPVSVQVEATTTTRKTTQSTTVKHTTAKSTTVKTSTAKSTTMRSTTAKSTTVKSTTEVAAEISSSSPRSTTLPEKPLEVDVLTEKRDFPAPTIIGARQGALLSPGEVRVFTCSAQAESIRWMVGDEERGEGAEEELRSNNLISSWAYTAKKSDSKVECVAVYQKGEIEKKASISFKVKEEQVVTLRNIEAKKSAPVKENLAVMEEESETKVEVQKTDFEVIDEDAVDRIAGFGAAPQEQFFEAGEEEVEAVDAKVGRSGTRLNKVEVGASVKEGMSAFASGSSHNTFSILTLSILLLVNHRLAL